MKPWTMNVRVDWSPETRVITCKTSVFRMKRSFTSLLNLSLFCLPAMVGCDVEPETLEALASAAEKMQGNEEGGAFSSMRAISRVSLDQNRDSSKSPANQSFQPDFPDRTDPFTFPEDTGQGQDTSAEAAVKRVEVLGFSNVNESRVFVRTRSGVKSIRVGERFDGIEVIQINSPMVEMKVGNTVWTATMFDHGQKR